MGVLSADERRKMEKPGRAPGAMEAQGWFWDVQFEVFTELLVFPLVFKIGLALPPFPLTWVFESWSHHHRVTWQKAEERRGPCWHRNFRSLGPSRRKKDGRISDDGTRWL